MIKYLLFALLGAMIFPGKTACAGEIQAHSNVVIQCDSILDVFPNDCTGKAGEDTSGFVPVTNIYLEVQSKVFHSQIECTEGGVGDFLPGGHNDCCKRIYYGKEFSLLHSRNFRAPPVFFSQLI